MLSFAFRECIEQRVLRRVFVSCLAIDASDAFFIPAFLFVLNQRARTDASRASLPVRAPFNVPLATQGTLPTSGANPGEGSGCTRSRRPFL